MTEDKRVSDLKKLKIWLAITVVLLLAVFAYPEIMGVGGRQASNAEDIPPVFSGNRVAYGWALFAKFTMSTIALRMMWTIANQFRSDPWREAPDIALYRAGVMTFCAMVFFGVAPDVAVLLMWGEADTATINGWTTASLLGDGISGMLFLVAATIVVRAEQLNRLPPGIDVPTRTLFFEIAPRRELMADHLRIMVAVAIIALGLALWK